VPADAAVPRPRARRAATPAPVPAADPAAELAFENDFDRHAAADALSAAGVTWRSVATCRRVPDEAGRVRLHVVLHSGGMREVFL
jgi:hypothetical protein